ncbi:class I SAM-dependent methyltransferase [Amycolatopsis sp. NPDC003865]
MTTLPERISRQTGLRRSLSLYRAFREEQTRPERFYALLAEDTAHQLSEYTSLAGYTVLDVGGGAGYFGTAMRARGAEYYLVEPDRRELAAAGTAAPGTIIADGYWLPFGDSTVDLCFSSNVLEHVPDAGGFLDEMVRVTKPGGIVYVSFTNWLSPWGGHETSPWHYLGGGYAARRYTRRRGRPPKNLFRHTLFPLHIGQVLKLVSGRHDTDLLDARPRYHPRPARILLRVPGLRELLTWNLVLVLRKTK